MSTVVHDGRTRRWLYADAAHEDPTRHPGLPWW
jgi:hypothetical protein